MTLDGERLTGDVLVTRLNALAGAHGVGRIDHVENRLVGIKSREIYEAPAAVVLHAAHTALETLTLGRDVFHLKRRLGDEWARLVYDGLWFGQLRSALAAFVAVTQEPVSGEVRLRLRRGTVRWPAAALPAPSTARSWRPTTAARTASITARRGDSSSSSGSRCAPRPASRERWRTAFP